MPSVKKCVAIGCNIDQNSNIILFGIPRPVPESWQKILSVNELNSKTKICEKHFKKCDIVCMGPNKKIRVIRIRKKCLNRFFSRIKMTVTDLLF